MSGKTLPDNSCFDHATLPKSSEDSSKFRIGDKGRPGGPKKFEDNELHDLLDDNSAQLSNNQLLLDIYMRKQEIGGRRKDGKGLVKSGAKRRRKALRENIQGITKPDIRRLARRGGVKRISDLIYEEIRGVLRLFLENVIRDAITYTEHAKRRTVAASDIIYVLKRQGRTLCDFGG
ncbi:histone H4-like [Glossina fuscipes]|uniref:Histone H4 n=1 Tax=Glossina fuscipes TaxID=7396 RepID=A0A8U0WM27_9MUSC|nr:histone H4-like [Glossina fuscipes]